MFGAKLLPSECKNKKVSVITYIVVNFLPAVQKTFLFYHINFPGIPTAHTVGTTSSGPFVPISIFSAYLCIGIRNFCVSV